MTDIYIKHGANTASYIVDQYDSVVNIYEEAKASKAHYDDVQQDLLHEIEWGNCNASEGYKLYKRLKECRIQRRIAEIQAEVLYPLYELLKTKGNFKKQLEKAKAECALKSKALSKRGYHCRTGEVNQAEMHENANKFQARIKDVSTVKGAKPSIWGTE